MAENKKRIVCFGDSNTWGYDPVTGLRYDTDTRWPMRMQQLLGADYQVIEGAWLNEEPYGVVHRITSDGTVKGAASACLTWAFGQCGNLKIDTHRANVVMQNMLKKNGFQSCGIIHVQDGSERLAYQKTK